MKIKTLTLEKSTITVRAFRLGRLVLALCPWRYRSQMCSRVRCHGAGGWSFWFGNIGILWLGDKQSDVDEHAGCNAKIGEFHERGCGVERCPRCGGQMIACSCVYELNNIDVNSLEWEYPDIWSKGPTEEMWKVYDAEIERLGGRIPRGRLYPGTEDAIRLGYWCRWVEPGGTERSGWHKCEQEHPEAVPDLNELYGRTIWNPKLRRHELPEESSN